MLFWLILGLGLSVEVGVLTFFVDDDAWLEVSGAEVVASEGVAGLYKGMVACWAKVMPSMAIAFMTFERCKVVLEF